MSSFGAGGQSVTSVHCLLKNQRFGRDSRFMLNKIFGALAANIGSGSTDGGLSSIAVCSLHGCCGGNLHIVVFLLGDFVCGIIVLVWCCAFGPLLRSVMEGDRPPQLRRYPSVLDNVKMIAVEYEGEAGFFHQRLILRTTSIAAILNTTGRMCDSPNGLFWILTPDGDVYPEILPVPLATGFIWLNERNEPIPTTMMPAGRHWEQVCEFGAHRRILLSPEVNVRAGLGAQETEDTCREGERPGLPEALPPPATPDTPLGRKVDEGDSLDPGDNVADPLLDARVLSVQRNSAGDRHRELRNAVSELVQSLWPGWPESSPRTFLWCCKFMSEHALHPVAHHSRF